MNKYDELLDRAKMFYDQPMVGELMNAVRELKERPEVVRCGECKRCGFCGADTNLEVMGFYGYCSRGERKEDE